MKVSLSSNWVCLNFLGLVPFWIMCYHTVMPSWVFRESEMCGSKFFSRVNFVGPRLFLECILLVHVIFSWVFHGSNFFLRTNFVNQRFSVVDCVRNGERKLKYTKTSQTVYSIPNRFQQLSGLFCIKKGHHLPN